MRFLRIVLICALLLNASQLFAGASEFPPGFVVVPPGDGVVQISGDIVSGREIQIAKQLHKAERAEDNVRFGQPPIVWLDSLGGDVETAIKIGRLVRASHAATTIVGECASACVLIYAGGAVRHIGINGSLVIHRPYLAGMGTNNASDIKTQYLRMRTEVTGYLKEMNVSSELFDLMQNIPPAEQRTLSESEAKALGLVETDPIEEELQVNKQALRYGLSREEYRRRDAIANNGCDKLSPSLEQVGTADGLTKMQQRVVCWQKIMLGK